MGYEQVQSFSLGIQSGTMAAGLAGAAPIVSIKWSDVGRVCVIKSMRLSAGSLVGFTAGFASFDLIRANGFSAADTGGGAVAWTAPASNKRRLTMGNSGFVTLGEIRASATATLSAGTRTLDTNPVSVLATSVTNVAGAPILTNEELVNQRGYPLVLSATTAALSEGLILRATVPATGTWQYGLVIEWEEHGSY